jgi:hypothetical protein
VKLNRADVIILFVLAVAVLALFLYQPPSVPTFPDASGFMTKGLGGVRG